MPIASPPPAPAGLPVSLGDRSPWQISVKDDPLLNINKDAPLPSEVDVVVIGSGLCGECSIGEKGEGGEVKLKVKGASGSDM